MNDSNFIQYKYDDYFLFKSDTASTIFILPYSHTFWNLSIDRFTTDDEHLFDKLFKAHNGGNDFLHIKIVYFDLLIHKTLIQEYEKVVANMEYGKPTFNQILEKFNSLTEYYKAKFDVVRHKYFIRFNMVPIPEGYKSFELLVEKIKKSAISLDILPFWEINYYTND